MSPDERLGGTSGGKLVWTIEADDSPAVRTIKRLLRESWHNNTRRAGFPWNRDAHGLLRALDALQEDAEAQEVDEA